MVIHSKVKDFKYPIGIMSTGQRVGSKGKGKKWGGKEVEAEKQEEREGARRENRQVDFPFSFALITPMVPWR